VLQPEWASVGQFSNPDKAYTSFMKWNELGVRDEFGHVVGRHDQPQDDFTLENTFAADAKTGRFTPVLMQTPWNFRMTPAWQLSYFDRLLADGLLSLGTEKGGELPAPAGTWLPFFYNDRKRTFCVLPALWQGGIDRNDPATIKHYPDVRRDVRQLSSDFAAQIDAWLQAFDLSALTPDRRQLLEQLLRTRFPEEPPPPYPNEVLEALIERFLMRFFHRYVGSFALQLFQSRRFHFTNFYHPLVCDFARLLNDPLAGIRALMTREVQFRNTGFLFRQSYAPTAVVLDPTTDAFYPREIVDFATDGSYSSYNWELFFHAPLLIGNLLSKNQRFEAARDWYHFIFNPLGVESAATGGAPSSKYWITKPFFETTDPEYVQQRIDNILRMLAGDASVPGFSAQIRRALEDQVRDWRTDPFEPHRIASYRTVAYQKTVVMRYLDNLIAWADQLFRQDSMESINEATQLYVLAAEILGPRPKRVPPQARSSLQTFNELEGGLDAFANALVEVENLVPPLPGNGGNADAPPLPMLYFCIPQNDKMLGYWDTVADRLFKIRHCRNIEGVARQLALFEPPLDPGALVKAVAAGVDLASALADLSGPLPLYRFGVLLQKANEVCNDVKVLGSALLAALEKKDAEALQLLRQGHEIRLLEAVTAVRERQVEEARQSLEALKKSYELAQTKKDHYESLEFMSLREKTALRLAQASAVLCDAIALGYALSGGLKKVPQFIIGSAGFGGSPMATAETGGRTFGSIAEDAALTLSAISTGLEKTGSVLGTMAGHTRRQEDWDLQKALAEKELEQLERSIAAGELRLSMMEKELENHALQIADAQETDEFMRGKYTNLELYQWQIGQISGVYFQSYQLSYDLAKRAERCFRFELGLQDSDYVAFGYWDSLKKGLLAGEKLQCDLRRLEAAYLEQNRREFELVKHVSLASIDALALVTLRETGRCFVSLPEEIFDLDYAGHYFRRVKSVSVTLPCVAGPFTTVSCTLRLLKNSIRVTTAPGDQYARNTDDEDLPADDDRFLESNVPVKAIAASTAQNDSGVFELSFRDERYLPFEGAGVISEWMIELFNDSDADFGRPLRQFDYGSISDVVLHMKYTAREDAGDFKNAAVAHLREYFADATSSLVLLDLRRDFASEWSRFLMPADPAGGNVFDLHLEPNLFPMRDAGKRLQVTALHVLARCTDAAGYGLELTSSDTGTTATNLTRTNAFGGLHVGVLPNLAESVAADDPSTPWRLKITRPGGGNLLQNPTTQSFEVEDVLVVLHYRWDE
jgi:hypothetical protein